jgi:hypothetical protein
VITLMAFAGAFVANELALVLVHDVRLAMKRGDLSLDYVARITGTPISRLSDQLNGKTPFTAFCRFYASKELREETDFWPEFYALQLARIDRVMTTADLGTLLVKVEALLNVYPKVMAKAELISAPLRRKGVC